MTTEDHWIKWHLAYEDPHSSMSRRLLAVQRRLDEALARLPKGPIRLASVCAGQGRDVIGVLAHHGRTSDVRATLVELDTKLAEDARTMAERSGLRNVTIQVGDASLTSAYADAVPLDILLVCGVFGNISDVDIHATVEYLPHLLARDATVIWTRHRRDPDSDPAIRTWFRESGFEELAFDTEQGTLFGVETHRLTRDPRPFDAERKLFAFVGDGADAHR